MQAARWFAFSSTIDVLRILERIAHVVPRLGATCRPLFERRRDRADASNKFRIYISELHVRCHYPAAWRRRAAMMNSRRLMSDLPLQSWSTARSACHRVAGEFLSGRPELF